MWAVRTSPAAHCSPFYSQHLATCSISCKAQAKLRSRPECTWTQSDLRRTLISFRNSSPLYHTLSEAECIVIVPPFFSTHRHVYAQASTTRVVGFISSRGRDVLLGTLGPSLSFCPILTRSPYLLPHCHNPTTYLYHTRSEALRAAAPPHSTP